MTPVAWAWIGIVTGLLVTALAAAAEGALGTDGTAVPQSGDRKSSASDLARAWVTLWVLNVLGPLAFGAGAVLLAIDISRRFGVAAALGASAVLVLVLVGARLLPVTWAARHGEATARYLALPLDVAARLVWPIRMLFRAFRRLTFGRTKLTAGGSRDDAVRVLANVEEENGVIEEDEMEMITGVMELGETKVREVMVPRVRIVAIPSESSLNDALETIIAAGHSRIPVYTESIDNIDGLLYAKDLLVAFRDHDFDPDLKKLLREPYYVPESKLVDELLEELQNRKVHMAVVIDEYGGTAGIVTIEDLIEEIVGEIQDEYDHEEPQIELVSDDEIVCHAGYDIDDVNRLMDIHLPTDDVDTLGGLVFAGLRKVPVPGERVVFDDAEIEVLGVDGRSIDRVRVVRRTTADDGEAEGIPDSEAVSSKPEDRVA
jgi:CBS domain containing-hemolysin-like protein